MLSPVVLRASCAVNCRAVLVYRAVYVCLARGRLCAVAVATPTQWLVETQPMVTLSRTVTKRCDGRVVQRCYVDVVVESVCLSCVAVRCGGKAEGPP